MFGTREKCRLFPPSDVTATLGRDHYALDLEDFPPAKRLRYQRRETHIHKRRVCVSVTFGDSIYRSAGLIDSCSG